MLSDLSRGQLSHVDPDAFEVGVNIATPPGKVIHETDLYQLIQYRPTTKQVFTVPLVIFPPWINRSEEHTSELQSLMSISYAVFCLKKKNKKNNKRNTQ